MSARRRPQNGAAPLSGLTMAKKKQFHRVSTAPPRVNGPTACQRPHRVSTRCRPANPPHVDPRPAASKRSVAGVGVDYSSVYVSSPSRTTGSAAAPAAFTSLTNSRVSISIGGNES